METSCNFYVASEMKQLFAQSHYFSKTSCVTEKTTLLQLSQITPVIAGLPQTFHVTGNFLLILRDATVAHIRKFLVLVGLRQQLVRR